MASSIHTTLPEQLGEEGKGMICVQPGSILYKILFQRALTITKGSVTQKPFDISPEAMLEVILHNLPFDEVDGRRSEYQYIDKAGDEWEPCLAQDLLQKSKSKSALEIDSNATWSIKPFPPLITKKEELEFSDLFRFQLEDLQAFQEEIERRHNVPSGNTFRPPLVREVLVYLANLIPTPNATFPWVIPLPCVSRVDRPRDPGLLYVDCSQGGEAHIRVTFSLQPRFRSCRVLLKSTLSVGLEG